MSLSKTRIAVFVSGGGTNLQALIDAAKRGEIPSGEIALVLASNDKAYALTRAAENNIPSVVVKRKEFETQLAYEEAVKAVLAENSIDMIVLAGFMSILSENFTAAYPKRIVNVHPSLIPSFCGKGFYGLHVHEAVLARGCRKLLYYGNCGVLCREIAAGHLIVPSAAYRDEGTSYHYLPAGDYVEIPTCRRMAEIMEELHLPCVTGRVWTTDAFYRETRRNMEARRAEGCIAVDMECASVMAAGQFRGAEIYQFLYADDCLDGEAWDPRTLGARPDSMHAEYLRLALEIAVRLL